MLIQLKSILYIVFRIVFCNELIYTHIAICWPTIGLPLIKKIGFWYILCGTTPIFSYFEWLMTCFDIFSTLFIFLLSILLFWWQNFNAIFDRFFTFCDSLRNILAVPFPSNRFIQSSLYGAIRSFFFNFTFEKRLKLPNKCRVIKSSALFSIKCY